MRTLVGSIGLVLAIPLTTLIAVLVVKAVGPRAARGRGEGRDGGGLDDDPTGRTPDGVRHEGARPAGDSDHDTRHHGGVTPAAPAAEGAGTLAPGQRLVALGERRARGTRQADEPDQAREGAE